LNGLEDAIVEKVSAHHIQPESGLAINARHRDCLRRALVSFDAAKRTLGGSFGPEYVAVDLQAGLRALDEITGAADAEEIRDSIFAQFCIGK
jgi:tRNA modification GTPase